MAREDAARVACGRVHLDHARELGRVSTDRRAEEERLLIARCPAILSLDVARWQTSGKEAVETALLRTRWDLFLPGHLVATVLLFVLHGRDATGSRGAKLHADAPEAARRYPPWPPSRYARPSGRLDEATTSDRDVRGDAGNDDAARTAFPSDPARLLHQGDHDRDHADVDTKADIVELDGFRWNAELDIRAIMQNLNHVRWQSPKMV